MTEQLTYETWALPKPQFLNEDRISCSLDVLDWAYKEYGDDVVYACSFGVEGIVLIDLIYQINPHATIVFLDTGLHFKETYDLIDKVKEDYPRLNIILKKPALTVQEQETVYGDQLWNRNPDRCCQIRKVIPLREALEGNKAWISGLRREQSLTRKHLDFINKDDKFQLVKICPLIHWSWKDVWDYVDDHKLPYNPLHDQGYPSIGCFPCTAKVKESGNLRDGRWANTEKVECGLHQN